MGNRFARMRASRRVWLNRQILEAGNSYENVEISTIMVAECKWSHMYLDAIIVEFCTQLRLRWRILVRLPVVPHTRSLDYDRGIFDIRRNGLTKEERKRRKRQEVLPVAYISKWRIILSKKITRNVRASIYHENGNPETECFFVIICQSPNNIVIHDREIGFSRKLSWEYFFGRSLYFSCSYCPFLYHNI